MTQPLYTVRQLAYVVKDMDAALKYWVDVLKVGPFYLFEHCPLRNQRYRGNPSNVDVTLALGNSGALQIELIVQHNDEPSVYKEFPGCRSGRRPSFRPDARGLQGRLCPVSRAGP